MKVAILGPGAVGGFLAALLRKAGHGVICVAPPDAARAIRERGMTLESAKFGTFTVRPETAETLTEPVDVLFITTKAPALKDAVRRIAPPAVRAAVIIPLLNGLEHMLLLRAHFGNRVAAGSIGSFEAYRRTPTVVAHVSPSVRVRIASDRDVGAEELARIASMLSGAGIPAEVTPREAEVLWEKLVRLHALALTTAASGETIGGVVRDPAWRSDLEACVREAAAVAAREGVPISAGAVMRTLGKLEIGETTSLARDVAKGSEGELDAIAGAVVRAGARHGIRCPVTERLMERVRERAARRKQMVP